MTIELISMKIIRVFLLIALLLMAVGCGSNSADKNNFNESISLNEEIKTMKVNINKKSYSINLEDNDTARSFANLSPLELTMNELNGNEKYVYLDTSLPTDSFKPKKINAGDVMLYGNNCLVIFYKTFDTSYSYTKIGHIDNLPDLGSGDISVIFEK